MGQMKAADNRRTSKKYKNQTKNIIYDQNQMSIKNHNKIKLASEKD